MGCLYQFRIIRICSNDDTAWIQIIVQSLGFTKKFWAEDNVFGVIFLSDRFCVSNRNGRFNDHDRIRIYFKHQFNHGLHSRSVEIVFLAVIVCRRCDHYIVSIFICCLTIQGCSQVKLFFGKIFLDIFILDRRFTFIDQINFFRNDINGCDMIVLCKQSSNRKSDITGTGNCNI